MLLQKIVCMHAFEGCYYCVYVNFKLHLRLKFD